MFGDRVSGVVQAVAREHPFRLFMWAAVQERCIAHLLHIHKDALLSGCYYVSVPPGAGELIFEDPRGALPPFGNRIVHSPSAGELILFPPWLAHAVAPSCADPGDGLRVSLSFNLMGSWDVTSDVSIRSSPGRGRGS